MLKPLICGSGAFHNSDDELELCSGTTKSKKSCKCRTKPCSRGVKTSKNPYATRGLDKFSSLVTDLKERRQRIYAQTKDADDTYVWFNFSGSDDCKPIILKMKGNKNKTEKKSINKSKDTAEPMAKTAEPCAAKLVHRTELKKSQDTVAKGKPSAPAVVHTTEMKKTESLLRSNYYNYADGLRQRPLLCLLAAVIMTLLLLIMFGRSGAVIWITVGWYMLPTATDARSRTKPRLNNKTKDGLRRSG